jgi:hypothetical protein
MTCRSTIASTALSFSLIFMPAAAPAEACAPLGNHANSAELEALTTGRRELVNRKYEMGVFHKSAYQYKFLEARINKQSQLITRLEAFVAILASQSGVPLREFRVR